MANKIAKSFNFGGEDTYILSVDWDAIDGKPEVVNGQDGKDGADGVSPTVTVSTITGGHRLTITDKNGTKTVDIMDGADGEDGQDGQDGQNGKDGQAGQAGADGERGHSILKVTTAPTSYTTATGGKNPIKRMALSTIKTQAKVDEVLVGDQILYSYYLYNIYYLDASYAYMDAYTSIRGATGAAGKAGADGYTPVKGVDYYTDADKAEIIAEVTEAVKNADAPEITISTNEVGYWWNNNGVPTFYTPSEGGACSKETNYIEAEEGDKFLVKTRTSDGHASNGAWYDANKNLISGIIVEGDQSTEETVTLTAPVGTAYARFFSTTWGDWNGEDNYVILEVTYLGKEASAEPVSPLKGKKIVYDGDSICSSWGESRNGGSYPKIIADIVGGTFDNQGVGGGRIVTQEGSSDTFHSIVDNLVNLPLDGDLYCFEGGVNDHWHGVPLGTYSESDYTGTLDKTTYCGALEYIFRYAITHFVGKPICYIITHKCPTSAFTSGYYGQPDTFADFRKKALGICEKYSIPVYDAWKDSGINSWNASELANFFIVSDSTGTGDGTHPNEEGYRRYYAPQLIDLFERIMPIGVTNVEPIAPPAEPTYTNLLDAAGWTKGIYLGGDGVEKSDTNSFTTGYLPVTDKGTIYLKNVTMPDESGHGNRICFYADDKSCKGSVSLLTSGGQEVEYDASGNLVRFYFHIDGARYIRLSAWNIDETSVITYNEPIE